jgi:hypothetical protein
MTTPVYSTLGVFSTGDSYTTSIQINSSSVSGRKVVCLLGIDDTNPFDTTAVFDQAGVNITMEKTALGRISAANGIYHVDLFYIDGNLLPASSGVYEIFIDWADIFNHYFTATYYLEGLDAGDCAAINFTDPTAVSSVNTTISSLSTDAILDIVINNDDLVGLTEGTGQTSIGRDRSMGYSSYGEGLSSASWSDNNSENLDWLHVVTAWNEASTGPVNVNITADPILSTGSLSGNHEISVNQSAAPISTAGSLFGTGVVSANELATAMAATGSLSAQPVMSVDQLAVAIAATGALSGQSVLAVNQLSTAIAAIGSLSGSAQVGNSIQVVADPIAASGSLSGQSVVSVDVAAALISGAGTLLGTVQITTPGNVLVTADPISATGSLSGKPLVSVVQIAAAIEATGAISGSGSGDLYLQAQPISASGSVVGSPVISVQIDAQAVAALGEMSASAIISVLQAAGVISASGQVSGVVEVIGPGALGVITDPSVVSVSPVYAVVSVTPRRGVTH